MSVVSEYSDPLTMIKYIDGCDVVIIPDHNYRPITALAQPQGTLSIYVSGCYIGAFSINFVFKFIEELGILDLTNNAVKICEGLVSTLKQRRLR